MRAFALFGGGVRVVVSFNDVAEFARYWPGFGTQGRMAFEFDNTGSLVGLEGDLGVDPPAVAALADDAARHARRRGFLGAKAEGS